MPRKKLNICSFVAFGGGAWLVGVVGGCGPTARLNPPHSRELSPVKYSTHFSIVAPLMLGGGGVSHVIVM